ncbi:MAG: DNA polymerase III subunit alpha [Simkaniaceae bacterium]|nr:DNA polymerase III subunit alpha [Simkaniaceae bacterium]MCF7851910.1 DNA polymerase III subunit alpha [Simkaniaceae bacterium]
MKPWIPLHVHSQYSILNATNSIKDLIAKAAEQGLSALALTDHCNMFGVVDFYKGCKSVGIKPIIGIEMMVAPGSRLDKKKQYGQPPGHPIVLLAKNEIGYRNLCKISSIAYLEGFYYTPRIDKDILTQYAEGLICLSGPIRGKIPMLICDDQMKQAREEISWFQALFKEDFYFEIQRHPMKEEWIRADEINQEPWLLREYEMLIEKQEKAIGVLKALSSEFNIPLVATNDIQYLEREDWKVHEILMNIQSGETCEIWDIDHMGNRRGKIKNPKRRVLFSHEYYFKSHDAMAELFKDLPEAIENTQLIAEKCDVSFDLSKKFYPVFLPPTLEGKKYTAEQRQKEAEKYLRDLSEKGMPHRYTEDKLKKVKEIYPDKDPMDVVKERFEYEFEIIASKGMCDYLLIVHDFIAWAKRNHIPVGPGRGSGAGSIILYLIGVTDIEPLRFHLFFERFINPERISYPDIDVDICMERRSDVIEYTLSKYGKDKVAQIITFGTMKAKMAIKDIGRVLNVPLAKVNEIAKLVPDDLNITIEKALQIDPDFKRMYESDRDATQIIDYGLKLEGTIRNTGIHAAGLIICGDPLTDHIPICNAKDSELAATQFAMKPVEMVGMLKIDFLGLKTLTSIQKTVDAIEISQGTKIDWVNLQLDDRKTFDLLNQGKTSGVFQLESAGMQDLAKQLHIDRFEEIIAVGALYRPGPMEMIPSFIKRKHGQEQIENDHPWMKDILMETYGIIVYQEQVMQIAQTLAGYSLGEGDVLRKAMGKKDHVVMKQEEKKFSEGAQKKGIDEKLALQIFNKVEKFASYGFNKSHATAYGYLSYVTAYLKANYPREWMAALMTCDMVDLAKISKHIRECQAMHIAILSPDVNESRAQFVATPQGIRFAMSAIKGVGEGVVEAIVAERELNGSFATLIEFIERLDSRKVGKKIIECLIEAGCFDYTQKDRAHLLAILHYHYDRVVGFQKEKAKGVLDLFSSGNEVVAMGDDTIDFEPRSRLYTLQREKELLGFYLTGHPLKECRKEMELIGAIPIDQGGTENSIYPVKTAFILETATVKISQKSGKKFAISTISDENHNYELFFWSDHYERYSHLLVENNILAAVLLVDARESPPRIQCKSLEDLTQLTEEIKNQLDAAYEQALTQSQQEMSRGKRQGKSFSSQKQESNKMKEDENPVIIRIDIDQMQLTGVIQLKKILRQHAGARKVNVDFFSKEKLISSIEIDAGFGVNGEDSLVQLLEQESFCRSVER